MKASDFIRRCEVPARRWLTIAEKKALVRLAKKHTGSTVLHNWKIYLFGNGLDAEEFERLYPVPNNFQSGVDPFAAMKTMFKGAAQE